MKTAQQWFEEMNPQVGAGSREHSFELLKQAMRQARDAALEEAASLFEQVAPVNEKHLHNSGDSLFKAKFVAKSIRTLKGK